MNWFANTLWTSIGKKLMMAVTGLCFCGFLIAHLAGNLTIYGGGEAFNAYAAALHSYGPLLTLAELGLLFFAAVHILTGATLFYQNLTARPVRYHVDKSAGGRTFGSITMPYTGFLLLVFVILHLLTFSFVDKTDRTIYQIVSQAFSSPGYVIWYIIAMIVAAIHVSHGLWSAFQTIGANHPKYMPIFKGASIVVSFIIGAGFGFIPLYVSLFA
jgi:succinate dehydrogenase / fumarate reductase cytochrome b subunit